jgi:putative membrane-bound dehydrogenase-like protein
MLLRVAATLLALAAGALACVAAPLGNLAPSEALAAFETEPGFVVELVAAEPLVIDPVALAFDERRRLFVAENRDYPTGSPDGQPLGRIALLEDTDGDGQMDARSEYVTGLLFPNGVLPWRGGVIVTAAPDVWWFADTDGDNRADTRELLLTGFDTNTTSQLRANDPTLGPDGWIHIAGGLRGGNVSSPLRPGVVVDTGRGDVRFNPDTGEIQLVAGKSQYGLAFDDAGNRFACMNRIHCQHAPLPARYLERNPHVVSPGALQNCPEFHDNSLMTRYTAGAARYFPISDNLTTADSHFGTYSAACAVHIYRGDALPSEYWGAVFSCDPTGNLVRGDRLEKRGGTFAALRIHEGTEALRSRDNWFRPVFIADGPEGDLYIADMCRKTIEHPEYLPGEVRRHTDFESGKDMGRIWRLRGAGARRASSMSLAAAPDPALIDALSSPTPWARDTAFRLLRERNPRGLGQRLEAAFRGAAQPGPAVAHLRLLHLFGELTDELLLAAMGHREPAVRQTAALLAEPRLSANAALLEAVLALASDPDPHARYQAALSLGGQEDPRVGEALVRIAEAQGDDRWTRTAILLALRGEREAMTFLQRFWRSDKVTEGGLLLTAELARMTAQREGAGARSGLDRLRASLAGAAPSFFIAALSGYAAIAEEAVRELLRADAALAGECLPVARTHAANPELPERQRLQAIELLACDHESSSTRTALRTRLVVSEPQEIQIAAARSLLRRGNADIAGELLRPAEWVRHAPALRTALVNILASRADLAGALLGAIENGAVPAGMLTPAQRETLRRSKDPAIRQRAETVFSSAGAGRQEAFEEAKKALALSPEPANGKAVFERACASCHRLNQVGVAVGPDLFDIRQQPKEAILFHIVVPEAEIAPNFVNYECELKDGRLISGLLSAESASSITLRMAQGVEETVLRKDIERLAASRLSMMPQELEKQMTWQELADLLAYLRGEQ